MQDLLTVEDAAARLGITARRVQQLITIGTLPARKLAGVYLIDPADLPAAELRNRKPGPVAGRVTRLAHYMLAADGTVQLYRSRYYLVNIDTRMVYTSDSYSTVTDALDSAVCKQARYTAIKGEHIMQHLNTWHIPAVDPVDPSKEPQA